jgi:hypothetical protein
MSQNEFVEFCENQMTTDEIDAFEKGEKVEHRVRKAILAAAQKAQKRDCDKFKLTVLYEYEYVEITAPEFAELYKEGETIAIKACANALGQDGNIDYVSTFYAVMDDINEWKNSYWRSNWGHVTNQKVRAEVIYIAAIRKLGTLGHPDYQGIITMPRGLDSVDEDIDWQRLAVMDQNYQTIRRMISPPTSQNI